MAIEIDNIISENSKDDLESMLNDNSVIIVNIKYNKDSYDGSSPRKKNLPDFFVLDLPERITQMPNKNDQKYYDLIETFVYNTLSKKFHTEVSYCQIWLQ